MEAKIDAIFVETNSVNTFDLIIGVVLILGTVRGFFKGFFVEITDLLGLVLGVYLSLSFNTQASDLITRFFSVNPDYIEVIAFALTFIVVVIGLKAIGKILTKVSDISALSLVNKLAGAGFGFLKAGLILCVLVLILQKVNTRFTVISEEKLENSRMYPLLEGATVTLWEGIGEYEEIIPNATK